MYNHIFMLFISGGLRLLDLVSRVADGKCNRNCFGHCDMMWHNVIGRDVMFCRCTHTYMMRMSMTADQQRLENAQVLMQVR